MRSTIIGIMLLFINGCATTGGGVGTGIGAAYTPVIDLKNVDPGKYQIDLFECRQLAAQVEANRRGDILTSTVAGAVVGAVVGGAGGDEGRRTGAKLGAAAGGLSSADSAYGGAKVVIKKCLAGRGYSILD